MARIGYWESYSPAATDFWASPEVAALYDLEPPDGSPPIAAMQDRYLAESRQDLEAHYAACWTNGRPFAVETKLFKADGTRRDCVVHGEPEFDPSGQVQRVFGVVRDVTLETSALRLFTESEQRLADFVSTASDWCWESGPDNRLLPYPKSLDGNAALQTVASGGKARWELSYAPEEEDAMAQHRADMEARRPFRDFVYTSVGSDGSRISISTSGKPIFADDGTFLGYRGTASDITQLEVARALLDQRTRALEEAHRLGRIGTWTHRLDTGRTVWSPELFQLLGLEPGAFEPTYESTTRYFLDDDAERLLKMQMRVLRSSKTEATDIRVRHADGTTRDLAIICKAEVAAGKIVGLIGTAQDVTDRKEAERRLEQLAYSDPLTGLANRALFKRKLAGLFDAPVADERTNSLLLIDLDRFKEVNDSLGHSTGDALLIHVSNVLRQELDPEAFIARIGGDEFAVLTDNPCASADEPITLANRIIAKLSVPVELAEGEACIGATIGIAILPQHGATAEKASRNADLALYMAKEAGRGRAQLFEPIYAEAVDQKLDLGRRLRHAVESGGLKTHYQPQIDLKTGRIRGFEALLRWSHPERGPISPSEFIPIAESTGLIVDLGHWVLRDACRQMRAWLDAGLPPRSVSVNVSPAQIWNGDFEKVVSAVLAETGLPAELLCLELTENLFVDHTKQKVSSTLAALSKLGIQLALDDFGSGYSSLGYLTRLPFNCLKIDRTFVSGIATEPEKRKLLGGIIALAHGLGMSVVAEGAELTAEVDLLTTFDCDFVQGYVFSKPVAADEAPGVAAEIERGARPAKANNGAQFMSCASDP
ncbi:EAL domain-containing protein [Rhodopseudomonas sp. HC1]|uniref:sensor domain-containing protein n=1 Tax=Rhodopseudomonas infernalis TaxID=2897386 RepID=UPI001EE8C190|nr:bifunctional diguanylate cyclase/phosphodiesterase [Rhodopseudomonas infernalis]MCG6206440.1 EAL domain-containing protein [Rhodopseudomonas infernalis]